LEIRRQTDRQTDRQADILITFTMLGNGTGELEIEPVNCEHIT